MAEADSAELIPDLVEVEDMPALDGDGALWLQIRRAIATHILGGDWPPGTRLPGETLLAERYHTARETVARAFRSLASERLVERRRKIGTVVTGQARERPVFELWDAADAVKRLGGRYEYALLDCAMLEVDSPLRQQLGVGPDTRTIRMLCLHLSDGTPFQLEERVINVEAAPRITCQPLEAMSPNRWLLANVPWTRAKHSIAARAAVRDVARHLEVDDGAACLVVQRQTWNEDVPVTFVRCWHPGDDYSLEGDFRPSW
jgi:GntR family histidine utilization transcriptional repressor